MKPLKQFIVEQLEPTILKNMKVTYDCTKEYLTISVPEQYSENDMQIYIQDRFLKYLPSDGQYSERFFGKNAANIDDAYFEYDSFSKTGIDSYSGPIDIEWDSQYDESKKDAKLAVFKISRLTYTILFNEFEIMSNNDGKDANALVDKIMKATESSDLNKYPIGIRYNSKKTEYDKKDELEK